MSINFSEKYILVLIPIIIFIVIFISRKDLSSMYEKLLACLRIVIFSLLVFALASPYVSMSTDKISTIFLYDISDSNKRNMEKADEFINSALSSKKDNSEVGLIAFGEKAFVDTAPVKDFELKDLSTYENGEFTNIASSIEASNQLVKKGEGKRLVILSDGNENIGDSESVAEMVKANNTVIDVFYTGSMLEKEVEFTNLLVPKTINKNAKYDIEASLTSLIDTTGNLRIYKNNNIIVDKEIEIKKGENNYLFSDVSTEGGYVLYSAEITSKDDTMFENNTYYAYTNVVDSPRVLVIEKNGSGSEIEKILLNSEVIVDKKEASTVSSNLDFINSYDCVILCNVEYEELPKGFEDTIKNYVTNLGGGFINTGGENAFAPGGYLGTAFEEILPVDFDLKTKSEDPSLGMIMVIDRSGSMATANYGVSVMEIAKEAAIRGVETMSDKDMLGVIAFDSEFEWVVPYGKIDGKKDEIITKIGEIQPNGGTSILPGFAEAYTTLLSSPAKYNHIILLTDGQAERTGYDNIISGMKKNGITLTTIAVGSGSDTALMESLAKKADGRFYFTNEFTNLPRIFAKETRLANKEYINNETFYPEAAEYSKITENIESIAPIDGYVSTTIKSRADMVLKSPDDEPVLATMNVGIGRTAAFTSDLSGNWTSRFLSSESGQEIIRNTVSYVMRKDTENVEISAKRVGADTEIYVKMPYDSTVKKVTGKVFNSNNESFEVSLSQIKPGEYKGVIPMLEEGSYIARANIESEGDIKTALSGFTVPYSEEYRINNFEKGKQKLEKLAEITGGQVLTKPEDVFLGRKIVSVYNKNLKNVFIVLALILFVFEIFIRRFDFLRRRLEIINAGINDKKENREKKKTEKMKEMLKEEKQEIKEEKEIKKEEVQKESSSSSIDKLVQRKRKR